jgi:hypothetical protein
VIGNTSSYLYRYLLTSCRIHLPGGHPLQRMNNGLAVLLLTIFIAQPPPAPTFQQSSWEDYERRTLQSIIDMHREGLRELGKHKDPSLISAKSFPSQIKLGYTGKSRPLAGKRRELVDTWQKTLKGSVPPNLVELFGTEMLFKEGQKEHWILVQKPLVSFLAKEVKPGQIIDTYIIWMGAIKDGDEWEWLFAMNEFDTPEAKS